MSDSSDPAGRFAEAARVTRLLYATAQRARDDFTAAVADLGLSSAMARTLLLLAEPAPMRTIADGLGCDPSYVTGVADDLESAGLARRVAGTDRRIKLLELTAAGHDRRSDVQTVIGQHATVLRLDDAQRAQLEGLLQLLVAPPA